MQCAPLKTTPKKERPDPPTKRWTGHYHPAEKDGMLIEFLENVLCDPMAWHIQNSSSRKYFVTSRYMTFSNCRGNVNIEHLKTTTVRTKTSTHLAQLNYPLDRFPCRRGTLMARFRTKPIATLPTDWSCCVPILQNQGSPPEKLVTWQSSSMFVFHELPAFSTSWRSTSSNFPAVLCFGNLRGPVDPAFFQS